MKRIAILFAALCLVVFNAGLRAQTVGQIGATGGPIVSVTAACSPNQIAVGTSTSCSASSFTSNGQNIDVTNESTWSSSNPSVARSLGYGMFQGVAAGSVTISANVGNGAFVATTTLSVGIAPLISQIGMTGCPPNGSQCMLPGGINTIGYSYNFAATGGVPPYTWSIDATTSSCLSGSGLSLSSAGALTGTAATGSYTCLIDVTDVQPVTTSLSVEVVVVATGSCGPPNYCADTSGTIVPPPAPPNVGGLITNGSTVVDTSYTVYDGTPSGNLSTLNRCTDSRSGGPGSSGKQSYSAGLGGAGDAVIINSNSTLALIDSTLGGYFMTLISGDKCVAPTNGSPPANTIFVTKNSDCLLGAGNACPATAGTAPMNVGPGTFDLIDPTIFWPAGGNPDFNDQLWIVEMQWQGTGSGGSFVPNGDFKYVPDPATHGGVITPIADFAQGLPLGANVQEWQQSTSYPYGAYVKHSLRMPGPIFPFPPEIFQYASSTNYTIGDLVIPGSNGDGVTTNTNLCLFKATITGTTSSSAPNFGNKNPCNLGKVTDGTEIWQNVGINAPVQTGSNVGVGPAFVFQNVGTAGTSCNAVGWYSRILPGNKVEIVHPDITSGPLSGDCNGLVWMNVGPNFVPSLLGWGNIAGSSSNHTIFGGASSTNTYGSGSNVPGGTGLCTNKKNGSCYFYGAGQDTGWWLSAYNVTTNTYALLNTMTGIQSNIVCSGGTGYNCAGGTFVWSTPGPAFSDIVAHDGVSLNCDFFIHGSKLNPAGDVMTTSGDTPILNPTACANVVNFWAWQPYKTPYDQFVNFQESGQGLNHFAIGNNTLFPLKSDYGSTLGVLLGANPIRNVSGNNGGLPPGCGQSPATNCLIWSGGPSGPQPTSSLPPYAISIAGQCQNSQTTVNNAFSIPIATATESSTTVTLTFGGAYSSYVYPVGAYITVGGVSPAGYDGQNILVTGSSAGQIQYTAAGSLGSGTVSSGAAVYNQLPSVVYGTLPTAYAVGSATGLPDCNISTSIDTHVSAAYNPSFTDTGRVIGYTYNLPTLSPRPFTARQGEITAYSESPLCGQSGQIACGSTNPIGTIWRFFHTQNTATNNIFAIQFDISTVSQDGRYVLFASDWGCTLGALGAQTGSLTGSGIPVQDGSSELGHLPVTSIPASVQSFCGSPWVASSAYQAGDLINPLKGTGGGGVIFDVFQAVSITGAGISGGGPNTPTGFTTPAAGATSCGGGSTSCPPTAHFAISAATESGNNATITTTGAANFLVGQYVNVSGMTPSGYNCSTATACLITATTSSTITYTSPNSGLGVGTGFGAVYGYGSQIVDGQVTWQDVGQQNGRGDDFLVKLQ